MLSLCPCFTIIIIIAEMALNADLAIQNRVPLDSETATAPSSSSSEMQATIESMDERHTVALVVNRREELELEVTNEGGKREGEGQRKRVRETANLDLMDHSGSLRDGSPERVAMEVARCLHESKRHLVGEVVRVLGVEKTLELFERTVVTQETGGVMTASGDKKKQPGGVFLTLVKEESTDEQKKDIFQKEKKLSHRRKRLKLQAKKQSRDSIMEHTRLKAEEQLNIFRSEFEEGSAISEWDCSLSTSPRLNKNMYKRLGQPAYQSSNHSIGEEKPPVKFNAGQLQEEKEAAEEFENTSEIDIDFTVD